MFRRFLALVLPLNLLAAPIAAGAQTIINPAAAALAGTETMLGVQSSKKVTITAAQLAALAAKTPSNLSNSTTFWTPAQINRLPARLFTGAASLNDGSSAGHADWLGALSQAGVINGDDLNFAQAASLTDPAAAPASMATPLIGFLAAANTTNSVTNSTPRALEALAVNNAPSGQNPTAWAFYHECHQVTGGGNCYGDENEVRNIKGAPASNWNPYNTPGGAINLELGCGAGLSATGQFNCPVAQYIAANPMAYTAGLSVLPGSIAPNGGVSPAIQLPQAYALQWWVSGGGGTLSDEIYGDASGNLHLVLCCGGLLEVAGNGAQFNDGAELQFGGTTNYLGGSTISNFLNFVTNNAEEMRVTSTGVAIGSTTNGIYKEQITGTLNVTAGYSANGTAGVTCSGAPTGSFAVANGIVTHC